jgi:hypothetical protein
VHSTLSAQDQGEFAGFSYVSVPASERLRTLLTTCAFLDGAHLGQMSDSPLPACVPPPSPPLLLQCTQSRRRRFYREQKSMQRRRWRRRNREEVRGGSQRPEASTRVRACSRRRSPPVRPCPLRQDPLATPHACPRSQRTVTVPLWTCCRPSTSINPAQQLASLSPPSPRPLIFTSHSLPTIRWVKR